MIEELARRLDERTDPGAVALGDVAGGDKTGPRTPNGRDKAMGQSGSQPRCVASAVQSVVVPSHLTETARPAMWEATEPSNTSSAR